MGKNELLHFDATTYTMCVHYKFISPPPPLNVCNVQYSPPVDERACTKGNLPANNGNDESVHALTQAKPEPAI